MAALDVGRILEVVKDAMVEHGPDGHTDGAPEIASAAIRAWLDGRIVVRHEDYDALSTAVLPYGEHFDLADYAKAVGAARRLLENAEAAS